MLRGHKRTGAVEKTGLGDVRDLLSRSTQFSLLQSTVPHFTQASPQRGKLRVATNSCMGSVIAMFGASLTVIAACGEVEMTGDIMGCIGAIIALAGVGIGVAFGMVVLLARALDTEGIGVVYDVPHDALFSAAAGHGLTVNGEKATVSATDALADSLVATGFPYRAFAHVDAYLATLAHLMRSTRGLRRHGAASVDLAWVAAGRFDAFFESGLSPWDVAAGVVLVEEGGGRCTPFEGDASPVYAGQIIASNGHLHAAMQEATRGLRGARG
mgnify:CR=1 FL=1